MLKSAYEYIERSEIRDEVISTVSAVAMLLSAEHPSERHGNIES
jgi:hypothetical protein